MMTNDDREVYMKGRPYIRGVLALFMFLRVGRLITTVDRPNMFFTFFEYADDFLEVFEKSEDIRK